ncbi:hypothetical protein SKAU_G00176910 [Synaphobranchus kaupii]|uniref:Uncharacterized protein n=1 Tax=Synaphobranchus kaupii TaxID=118154 RepID=A0A9Q1FLP6_SYNKA|nr:hypothetical protein SKAU_G00176910 [Synaphobranchus kaupii]
MTAVPESLWPSAVCTRAFESASERKLCAHPYLEIYKEEVIEYVCPLSRQSDFYVPEARDKEKEEESEEDRQTDVAGVDSNSETSSLSQMAMSESRETSLAPSTVPSLPEQEPDDSNSDKNSAKSEDSASSFEELELEPGRGQEDKDCPPAKEVASVTPDLLTNEQAAVGAGEE